MDDVVKKYKRRKRKRIVERYDGLLEWITLKNGVHVPVKDGKAVGGPVEGEEIKAKRKQIESGKGKVPYSEINEFNKKALESIKEETGMRTKEAKKFHKTLKEYFGGDYKEFTSGNRPDAVKIIDDGLSKMRAYDGEIYRGMNTSPNKTGSYVDLEPGDELSMKSISSWSSDKACADWFTGPSRPGDAVMLVCKNNKSGVGMQHISRFRDEEAEVLVPSTSRYRVKDKKAVSKWDMAQNLVKEYEGRDTEKAKKIVRMIKQAMETSERQMKKRKYVIVEVEEI